MEIVEEEEAFQQLLEVAKEYNIKISNKWSQEKTIQVIEKRLYDLDVLDKEENKNKTVIVHLKRSNGKIVQDCDVYIGRQCNMGGWHLTKSKWYNPFKVGKDGTIFDVLSKYENYIRKNKELMDSLVELKGKRLGCWCVPKPCHGNILIKLMKEKGILPDIY